MNNKINFRDIVDILKKVPKLVYIILILIVAIIIAIILLNNINEAKNIAKYAPYEEKMQTFGLDKLYDNKSAKSSENVTKSEAIKVVLGAIYNTEDISGFAYDVENNYANEVWAVYATKQKILPEGTITSQNQSDKISYADAIIYLVNARALILKVFIDGSKDSLFSDLYKYNQEQRNAINDVVANELIENSTKKIDANKNITKGQLNELIYNFAVKYSTITVGGAKLNINPEKTPSNASIYPYILADVDKSVYETPLTITVGSDNTLAPKESFLLRKEYYAQMKEFTENYYNYILNIDYTTINATDFKNSLDQYCLYPLDEQEVQLYVDYVKANKLKITGKAEAQLPIVYYNGIDFKIRLKLDFKIESGDTKNRVLFGDLMLEKAEYKDENYVLVDASMGAVINSKSLFVDAKSIQSYIVQ